MVGQTERINALKLRELALNALQSGGAAAGFEFGEGCDFEGILSRIGLRLNAHRCAQQGVNGATRLDGESLVGSRLKISLKPSNRRAHDPLDARSVRHTY